MFDQDADRTLPPTERRRRDARSRGEVAQSSELTAAITLLAGSAVIGWLAPGWATSLVELMRDSLRTPQTSIATVPFVTVLSQRIGQLFGTILLSAGLIVCVSALAANIVQTGWIWMPTAIAPRWRFRGLFSWERCLESTGWILRLCLLVSVAWIFASNRQSRFLTLSVGDPAAMLIRSAQLIGELCVQLAGCMVLLAVFDYGFRFWRHEQGLKMTVEERRREQLDDQVDPRIKQRRAEAIDRIEV
jgi:flagellar biosynthesis protein FlhB